MYSQSEISPPSANQKDLPQDREPKAAASQADPELRTVDYIYRIAAVTAGIILLGTAF